MEFLVPKEMVATSSVRLFILWTTLPSIVLVLNCVSLSKKSNPTIGKISKAAERFGKGRLRE